MQLTLTIIKNSRIIEKKIADLTERTTVRQAWTQAKKTADRLFGKRNWHVKHKKNYLFGGYIVDKEGNTLTIE